jgi:mono/diheme cytochrome c family protein
MKVHGRARHGVLTLLALAFVACGDAATTDRRGYTKAPLESPGPLIRAEQPGEMARYGQPNRVVADRIELPEMPPAGAAAAPTLATVTLPDGVTQEMVAQGEELFNRGATCFTCHGSAGVGGPLAPALNEDDWIHVDGSFESLVQIIDVGVAAPQQYPAPMPARGGSPLTDEQVREIAAYVYAISR